MNSKSINPLAIQALNSLELLKSYLEAYKKTNKVNALPLQVIHLYSGTIIKNAKKGRSQLSSAMDLKFFDFMMAEIDTMFSVIGGSCIKYCEDIESDEVPEDILDHFFNQMVLKISD